MKPIYWNDGNGTAPSSWRFPAQNTTGGSIFAWKLYPLGKPLPEISTSYVVKVNLIGGSRVPASRAEEV